MTMSALPPHVGPLLPAHRKGHCGWNPNLDGKSMCNAPAERHFWVGKPAGVDGIDMWTGWSCEEHWQKAYDLTHPIDWHPVETPCLEPGSMWFWSTDDRAGFCYLEEDGLAEETAVLELVTAGDGGRVMS